VVTLTTEGAAAVNNDALVDTDYNLGVTANDGTVDSAEAFAIVRFDAVDGAPGATDDFAETCYDNIVHVDVLANDTNGNGNGNNLTITAVNGQAILEGGPAIDVDGVMVTLESGQLVMDGSTVYADLLTGEEVSKDFTYTVSHGNGNGPTATATAQVTFTGVTDTLAKVNAELISNGTVSVQVTADNIDIGNGVGSDAFTIKLTDAGSENGVYAHAYSLNFLKSGSNGGFGSDIDDALLIDATLTVIDEVFISDQQDLIDNTGINGEEAIDNLDLINWIINQDFENTDNGDGAATTYTGAEVQGAVWALTNGQLLDLFGFSDGIVVQPGLGTVDNAQEIVDLALANGEGFEAGAGDLVGVYVDSSGSESEQPFIVGINLLDHCDG
jgi:hypothetical protein